MIQEQLELTLKNLKESNIIDDNMKLEEYISIIMDPAYVHINTKTTEKINKLKEQLKDKNVYTIGRYGAWIYNSMEDSMVVAKELAETNFFIYLFSNNSSSYFLFELLNE